MPIPERALKVLWARANGRCSKPDCHEDLTPKLAHSGNTVLGEMAHIIGRRPGAARSDPNVGENDAYENLILLCPTHHTLIDRAEADFPPDLLRQWKSDWEYRVSQAVLQLASEHTENPLENRTWAYFNFGLILELCQRYCSPELARLKARLLPDRIVSVDGFPLSGSDASAESRTIFETWPQEPSWRLKRSFSDAVERIIKTETPFDFDENWGIRKLTALTYPGMLAFINRRCFFKTIHRRGAPEEREVRSSARGIELRFQIDTWNVFGSSALHSHFRGGPRVAALLLFRSMERPSGGGRTKLLIKATPVALGVGFWEREDRTPAIAYERSDEEFGDGSTASDGEQA